MKKSISQLVLSFILNGISILSLLFLMISLLNFSKVNLQLDRANENRFALTYNANRFMNGSAYLTNMQLPATRCIMTTTGMKSTP